MIRVYTNLKQGHQWLQQYQKRPPVIACILGFTATGLIPGISAAGATPSARQYTAIADAEFLVNGVSLQPQYPLPPLELGVSPVLISRAVVEAFNLPIYLFNAGLPHPPTVPAIDLGGAPALCLSTGAALPLDTVYELFEQGLEWGHKLAAIAADSYVILSECVVGGTTTALSVLTGLGIDAAGKVNSSHPRCNHAQKWEVVQRGLKRAGLWDLQLKSQVLPPKFNPLQLVAAVGDPMQIVAAAMTITASRSCGVLLAGGTQMLAVYALAQALGRAGWEHRESAIRVNEKKSGGTIKQTPRRPDAQTRRNQMPPKISFTRAITAKYQENFAFSSPLEWQPTQVVVGTTRWVAEDSTGDTVGLATEVGDVPLLATELSFAKSGYPQLRAYEQGYVKEGVGAGGCSIAAHLYQDWSQTQLLTAIESLLDRYSQS
ncbi:MAG: TIGR00303 family protein [Symploca sp. SIO2E9]|nr:TIGR00303 family protein [Symploca sp. SIO2E9]